MRSLILMAALLLVACGAAPTESVPEDVACPAFTALPDTTRHSPKLPPPTDTGDPICS